MQNLVKIILALCLDFSIKSQGIQNEMLEMGHYIKELKSTKEEAGKNRAEIERLEKEIKVLIEQLDNMRTLYNSYKEIAKSNVDTVTEEDLLAEIVALKDEVSKQTARGDRCELRYSDTEGRKNYYRIK